MTLIDDGADDLITFGLVHTIERFDDPVYLQHWLAGLPQLTRRSPRWAEILLLRVLNSPRASAELLERAADVAGSQRVLATVDELDLQAFYDAYRADGHGRAAHDPEPRKVILRQPIAQARRHQQDPLTLARQEVLGHQPMSLRHRTIPLCATATAHSDTLV